MGDGEGKQYYTTFLQQSQNAGICVSRSLQIPDGVTDADVRSLLRNLAAGQGAKVVVLFTDVVLTLRILQLAQDLGIARNYVWVFAVDYADQIQSLFSGSGGTVFAFISAATSCNR